MFFILGFLEHKRGLWNPIDPDSIRELYRRCPSGPGHNLAASAVPDAAAYNRQQPLWSDRNAPAHHQPCPPPDLELLPSELMIVRDLREGLEEEHGAHSVAASAHLAKCPAPQSGLKLTGRKPQSLKASSPVRKVATRPGGRRWVSILARNPAPTSWGS